VWRRLLINNTTPNLQKHNNTNKQTNKQTNKNKTEAYDVLKTVGGLSNEELAATFTEWNKGELSSFLVEISAIILTRIIGLVCSRVG
jgi:6-phosphogluconate dehydrogenase